MKMHELLSEAPAAGSMAIPLQQGGPSSAINTHTPSTAANLWRQNTGAGTPPPALGSWSRLLRMKTRNAGPKLSKYLTRGDLKDLGAGRAVRGAGMYLTMLKWLGFYDFVVEYWTNVNILEAMIKSGELDRSEYGPAKRMIAEELAVKIMLSNAFPNIIKWFFRLRFLRLIPAALGGLATIFTGGAMGAPAIAGILATEVMVIALQNFLKTPAGKEIVSWIVVYAIDPGFKWLYDQGPGRFFGKLKELSSGSKDKILNKTNPDAPIGPAISGLLDKTVPDNSGGEEGDAGNPDDTAAAKDEKPAAKDEKPTDANDKDKDKKPADKKPADKKPADKKPANKDSDSDMFDPTKAILGFDPGKIKIDPLK